ncbi:hypothetical protein AD941_00545 [Gluconobacter albidus]|uniref:Phage protein n=1 Tax=Gluconobacter albidus TaxID=318683 RepID=A0AAW3R171_9PROT|nr:hypothetical protein [Gluconobacter albidus]KXV42530.1 hypothetical protein AD941_00545 [Gluconobacter albidus]
MYRAFDWHDDCRNGKNVAVNETGIAQDDKTLERLEEAMMRIAAASERHVLAKEACERALHSAPDLSEFAANIDALCARIQGVLNRKEG